MALKFRRIFQPHNPLFWLMMMLNTLSVALAWIVQNRALNTLGILVVGGFAIVNAIVGTWLLWRLASVPAKNPSPEDQGAS